MALNMLLQAAETVHLGDNSASVHQSPRPAVERARRSRDDHVVPATILRSRTPSGKGPVSRSSSRSPHRGDHNVHEKIRRANLKNCYQNLRRHIPALASNSKASMVEILSQATVHISEMAAAEQRKTREIAELRRARERSRGLLDKMQRSRAAQQAALLSARAADSADDETVDVETVSTGDAPGSPLSSLFHAATVAASATAAPPRPALPTAPRRSSLSVSSAVSMSHEVPHSPSLAPDDVRADAAAAMDMVASGDGKIPALRLSPDEVGGYSSVSEARS